MKKIILSLLISLFLAGCGASKNKSVVADKKVSEPKAETTSKSSEEEGEDGECTDE